MNNVRELRKRKGIQQKELAIEIGVSNATVSDWEHGRKNPSGERLRKLADFFDVDPPVVLGHSEPQNVFVPENPEVCGKTETEQIIEKLLEALGNQPRTEEAKNISIIVDNQPKEEREKAEAIVRALFSQTADQFEKRENNET